MDDTRRVERSASEARDADARDTFGEQEASFEAQARRACDDAALRYQAVRAALDVLEAGPPVEGEAARALEEARLHVEAARLAWYNTVVHYERVLARRRATLAS